LIYGKLSGQQPDFRELARPSVEYQRASAFSRDAVADRVAARYSAAYTAASPDAVYTLNVNASLLQYDAARGGWPSNFGADKFVPFPNPLGGQLELSFDNIDDFNALPQPQAVLEVDQGASLGN
jgi:hypothetical protein